MHQRVKLTGHPKAVMPSSLLSSALRPGKRQHRQQVQEPEAVDAPPVDVGSSEDDDEDEKDVAAAVAPVRSRAKPGLRPPMPTNSKGEPRSGRGADDVKPAKLSKPGAKAAPRPDIPPERRSARQQAAAATTTTVSLKRGSHGQDSVSSSSGSSSLSEPESADREAAVRASPKKKVKITAADKRPGSGPASMRDDENQLLVPLRPTRKPQTTYAGRRQHGKSAALGQHNTPAESSARPVPRHGRLKLDSDPERDRTGQRLSMIRKAEGIISSPQPGTGKTAINSPNEDGHARLGARADPRAGRSGPARQKGAGGGRARPARKADKNHDEAPPKPIFEKHKVDLDEGDEGDEGEGDGEGDAPPRKAHAEDDDRDSVLSSPPPEEDDVDDSDDDLSSPPALDRSPSKLSPSKPTCPLCGKPVELARLDELSGGSRMPIDRQAEFCHSHMLGSARDEWRTRKYPEIDWPRLEARIESHRVALQSIIEGRSPSHFAARLTDESAKPNGRGLVPGYYGPRGSVAMSEILTRQFGRTLAERAAADRPMAGRGTASFVQAVLVPEAALRLIMEDMAVGGEEEAREIMRDSAWIGELVHAAGGGYDALQGAEDESELSDLSDISD